MPKKKIIAANSAQMSEIAMRELAHIYQSNRDATMQRLFDRGLNPYQVQGILEFMDVRMLELHAGVHRDALIK